MFVLKLYNDGFAIDFSKQIIVTLQIMNQKSILCLLTPWERFNLSVPSAVAAGFVKGATCLLKNELTEEELLGSTVLQELLPYGLKKKKVVLPNFSNYSTQATVSQSILILLPLTNSSHRCPKFHPSVSWSLIQIMFKLVGRWWTPSRCARKHEVVGEGFTDATTGDKPLPPGDATAGTGGGRWPGLRPGWDRAALAPAGKAK